MSGALGEGNVFLSRGIELAKKAIEADNAGEYGEALAIYQRSIQTLLTAAKYERNGKSRDLLTQRISAYLSRAETLKKALGDGHKPESSADRPKSDCSEEEEEDLSDFDLKAEMAKRVGMAEIKEQLVAFEHGLALDKKRRDLTNSKVKESQFPHCLFKGPPGSGKTTMARLLAKSLKKLGVLKTGRLVEVQRSDLVGTHIGHTAVKTRAVVEKARGGVLFLDECYRLAGRGENDFGKEALEELMSAMEDKDIVFIFAGYDDEHMDEFVELNPGLFRRIHHVFTFQSYSVEELAQIFLLKVDASGFRLAPPLKNSVSAVADLLRRHTTVDQRHRLNGGLADHLLRNAKSYLDRRLTLDSSIDHLLTYTPDDLVHACADLPTPPPLQDDRSTPAAERTRKGPAAAAAAVRGSGRRRGHQEKTKDQQQGDAPSFGLALAS
mmetsp:Transcript_6455/g.20157  ORF Transcript_6455/g.20157 Transcript_6455/m.20157 type:complete len:438 (+) Transcript_6455:77-1390(+)